MTGRETGALSVVCARGGDTACAAVRALWTCSRSARGTPWPLQNITETGVRPLPPAPGVGGRGGVAPRGSRLFLTAVGPQAWADQRSELVNTCPTAVTGQAWSWVLAVRRQDGAALLGAPCLAGDKD